jgi:hypothetical protein
MVKKQIYPKTIRYSETKSFITEKLDGSNIGIFKINEELVIAQRNHVFKQSELTKENSYKGLREWLSINGDNLKEQLLEQSGFFGEWISMGQIKYTDTYLNKKVYMFAKANIDEDYNIRNLQYNSELFIYPFEEQVIPSYIGVVPLVAETSDNITRLYLDVLYDKYTKDENRNVEGFIINRNNTITKYVRMKNGKAGEHTS